MDSTIAVDDTTENQPPHISPNPLKCPPPPTPLNQMSPERMNQQRLPQSPSLHSYMADHDRPRTRDSFTSDVQSKVAFLNGLANASTHSSPTRPRKPATAPLELGNSPIKHDVGNTNGAFQRAVMGYEEAQASLATLTAELERSREEIASRKKRERLLSQRVEDLLEEMQAEKERRVRDQESYTKEIKRCRKETYRAEMAVVEARQDLQDTRAELKKAQAEVQHEKNEKEKSRQESFERAYALAGTVGELDQVKDQLKVAEKERDAALLEAKAGSTSMNMTVDKDAQTDAMEMQTEQVAADVTDASKSQDQTEQNESVRAVREAIKNQWAHHIRTDSDARPGSSNSTASGPRIATDRPQRPHAPKVPDFATVIARLGFFSKQWEGEKFAPEEEIKFLKQELAWAKRKHAEDADLIHLMHIQCQFKACPCRLAESNGERFVHDQVYDAKIQQQRASKKRKIGKEADEHVSTAQVIRKALPEPSVQHTDDGTLKSNQSAPPAHLPPDPVPDQDTRMAEDPLVLEQAIEVPLPDVDPMELDLSNFTPDGTAQLEDITQVLVEPAAGSKSFAFSTSVSSTSERRAVAQPLRHTESASAALDSDLFDLSPPKQLPPRRPSTVMGILNMDSPMRLVPESPRSVRAPRDNVFSTVRERNHTIAAKSTVTTTTKIALKDSPSRATLHRRAQSKPNLRSHSPLVTSAVMSQHDDLEGQSTFNKEPSASPAASTVFPMTPVHKHSRSMHNLAQHAQMQAQQSRGEHQETRSPPQTMTTTTTTTRVPLRSANDADEDDVFSPEQARNARTHVQDHAQTEVLNIPRDVSKHQNARQAQSHPQPISSSALLANVPGTPISREAALAQIRARRDRARSVNLKRSLEGNPPSTARSPTKGAKPVVVNGGGLFGGMGKENMGMRNVREISQASAPGRFGV